MYYARALYFIYYAAMAAVLPYLTLYYESSGLSGTQIGLLVGLMPLVMLIGAPLWSEFADATGRHRTSVVGFDGHVTTPGLRLVACRLICALGRIGGPLCLWYCSCDAAGGSRSIRGARGPSTSVRASAGVGRVRLGLVRAGGGLGDRTTRPHLDVLRVHRCDGRCAPGNRSSAGRHGGRGASLRYRSRCHVAGYALAHLSRGGIHGWHVPICLPELLTALHERVGRESNPDRGDGDGGNTG